MEREDIKRFNLDDKQPHVIFDSLANTESYFDEEQNNRNKVAGRNMDEAATALNQLDKAQRVETLGIWNQMRGASEYNIYGQRALDAMLGIKPNESLIVYDIESLGTPSHMRKEGSANFFSPTELALHKGKYMNGDIQLGGQKHHALSMLLKPNKATSDAISSSIKQLRATGWRGMSDDMKRTLVDLTAYSGDPKKLFEKRSVGGQAYTHVLSHAPKLNVNASLGMSSVIDRIEQGFSNLKNYGTVPEHAIDIANKFVPNKRGGQDPVRFVGYNIYNYDEQALREFFSNNVAKNNPDSHINKALSRLTKGITDQKNIDLMHALKTTTANPYTRFGTDMTLSNVHSAFGYTLKGSAHHGLSDVGMTAEIFGKVQQSVKKAEAIVGGINRLPEDEMFKAKTTSPFYWDKKKMKVGQELYAFSGLPSYQAGDYDGVYRKGDNGLEKMYDLKQNPVYARTMYKVDQFFENVELGGKKHYGVQLGTDEGQAHILFRESKEELQKALHSHFMPVGKNGIDKKLATNLQNEDRGLRRYEKMFSISGGTMSGSRLMDQMYKHIDETKGMSAKDAEAFLRQKYGKEPWMTDAYLRDFKTVAPRLKAEAKIWKPFLQEAESLSTNTERTAALSHFRTQVKDVIGNNNMMIASGGEPFMSLEVGGKTAHLRGFDRSSMVRTIRSSVERNGTVARANRVDMIKNFNELVDNNLIPAFENQGGKSMGGRIREMKKNFHQEVMANNKVSAIYEQVATMIGEYMNMGFDSMKEYERERVSALSPSYLKGINSLSLDKAAIQKSIQSASYFGKALDGLGSGDVQNFFAKQREYAMSYTKQAGLDLKGVVNHDPNILQNIHDMESKVKGLAKEYMDKGFRVQMMYDKARGLSMGIMDANAPESLARSGYNGLRKSNQATVIDLPYYTEGGKIKWRNQQHLNRFVAGVNKNGSLTMNTVLDEAFSRIKYSAGTFREMLDDAKTLGKQDSFIRMESRARSRVQRTLEGTAMDYYKGYSEKEPLFDVRSNRANYVRSMQVDMSKLAENWYAEEYDRMSPIQRKAFGFDRTVDQVKAHAEANNQMFVQSLDYKANGLFQTRVDQWANEKFGLQVDAHGVNDRAMSKGMRSLAAGDPRRLGAMAAYDPTSGENRLKALNYFRLNEGNIANNLSSQGESDAMMRIRTDYGVVSQRGLDVKGNEINGISMRMAYMTDEQIAKSIGENKTVLMNELAGMLQKGEISADDFKKYTQMINNGQLTSYEGKAVLASEFRSAFDVVDEVRERLKDGYTMDSNLKNALEKHAKELGQEFDINRSINFADFEGRTMSVEQTRGLMDKGGMLTIGSMQTEDIATGDLKDHRTGYRGSNKDVFIKGWDAEQQMLILGKHMRGEEGMKTVTDTGRRHEETFVPKRIIGIVTGNDQAEGIIPHFGDSKKMQGAYMEEKIRVYEDELKRQLHGESTASPDVKRFLQDKRVTIGDLSKAGQMELENEAIEKFVLPKIQEHLGLDNTEVYAKDGKIMTSEGFGYTNPDKVVHPDGFKKLDADLGQSMNYNFRKDGVEMGQAIKQRHDVWADQHVVGKGGEGRVRLGMKELTAMRQHLNDIDPGAASYVDFLDSEVRAAASKANPQARQTGQYLMNVLQNGAAPKAGDIVFDTSAYRPEMDGKVNARLGEGGVLYVNPDTTNHMPQITAKDTKVFADEYAGTLLDNGRIKIAYDNGSGIVEQDVKSYLQGQGKNGAEYKGASYLKLPDNTFGKEYMPLVDFENIGRGLGDGAYLNEMQKTQRNIIEDVTSYNQLGGKGVESPEVLANKKMELQSNINANMQKLDKQMNTFLSSGKDSSFLNNTVNARVDMSGHFRAQGANPFMSYEMKDGKWENTGAIKENTAYISKNDMKQMIAGAEDNILEAWKGKNEKLPTFKDLGEKQNYILDNLNNKGLYGTTIRYPIIDASTAQTMKYEVADWVADKSMYVGIGSASRIAGDFDGDNFAGLLTGYKSKNAKAHHMALEGIHQKEVISSTHEGAEIMKDLSASVKKNLMDNGKTAEEANHIIGTLQNGNIRTMKDLAREGFDDETIQGIIRAKTHAIDNTETVIARTGKEFIGHIDNARQRITSLHDVTTDTLVASGDISKDVAARDKAIVNETMRRLSQDSISSKKFTVQTLMKDESWRNLTVEEQRDRAKAFASKRNEYLMELRGQLYDRDMDIQKTMGILENLGVVKDAPLSKEIGIGRKNIIEGISTDKQLIEEGLNIIRETNRKNQHIGGYDSISLKVGASIGTERVKELFEKGVGYAPTQGVKEYEKMMNEEGQERFARYKESYQNQVVRAHRHNSETETLMREIEESKVRLDGRKVLQDNYVDKRATTRFRDVLENMMPQKGINGSAMASGAAGGALGFAALWAMSAALKTAPTPEGMREQQAQAQGPAVPTDRMLTGPTARISENGEYINLKISAKNAKSMSSADVAAMVNGELQAMTNTSMNMNMNISDNSQKVDPKWLQDIVANAVNKGYGF